MTIVGILASIAIPKYSDLVERARRQGDRGSQGHHHRPAVDRLAPEFPRGHQAEYDARPVGATLRVSQVPAVQGEGAAGWGAQGPLPRPHQQRLRSLLVGEGRQ
ncbi:MAG: hypothetical protein IPN47_10515 [Gemmatimonadetes bacterium]|nr:hypothetical protein [Gemmatimonadota bacterium]